MNAIDALMEELDALPQQQLAGVFPFVVLMVARAVGEVPPSLAHAGEKMAAELRWAWLADDVARAEAANAWRARHGVDAAVWERLVAALHDDPTGLRHAALRIGVAAPAGVLQRTAPPPPGTVAAGPFARHRMNKP